MKPILFSLFFFLFSVQLILAKHQVHVTETIRSSVKINEQQFRIGPNPFKTNFYIESVGDVSLENTLCELYDITGKRVNIPLQRNSNRIEIDGNMLESGIYFVKLQDKDGKVYTYRVVKN